MISEVLLGLGLNEKEIAMYLALLPVGSAPASALGKRTGIHRSTAQYICQSLAKKGLVTAFQKNNTFLYAPNSPKKLLTLLALQKADLEAREAQMNRVIGDLINIYDPKATLPKVRFFEGLDGVIEMFEDVIMENKPLYGAALLDENTDPQFMNYVLESYVPKRAKIGNPAKVIFNDNRQSREYRKNDKVMHRISLLLPLADYPFEACCHVYGDKVAFYSYRTTDLSGVIIENTHVRKTVFSLLRASWNYARTLPENGAYKDLEMI